MLESISTWSLSTHMCKLTLFHVRVSGSRPVCRPASVLVTQRRPPPSSPYSSVFCVHSRKWIQVIEKCCPNYIGDLKPSAFLQNKETKLKQLSHICGKSVDSRFFHSGCINAPAHGLWPRLVSQTFSPPWRRRFYSNEINLLYEASHTSVLNWINLGSKLKSLPTLSPVIRIYFIYLKCWY